MLPLAACGAAGDPGNVSAADMRIAPGLWERSGSVVDARGENLPIEAKRRLIGPRPSARFCVTPGQAARPGTGFVAGGNCAWRALSLEGGRLRGTMACRDEAGPSEAAVDGRYGPQSYDLRIEIVNRLPGDTVLTLDVRSRGRRIGPCPQGGEGKQ